MRKTLVLLLMLTAFCVQNAGAQQSPSDVLSQPWYSNLSIGVRFGGRFLVPFGNLDATVSNSATDPPQTTTIATQSATKRFQVGPTVHLQMSDRWAVTFDALYSRAGYDAASTTETQTTDGSDPDFVSALYERTRADYWDFPILARYYYTGFQEDPARLYLTAGIAVRTVSGVNTFSELFVDQDRSDTSTTPVTPEKKTVPGAVVGGGFRLHDEVGLRVDMEVRYTRWLQRTFDSSVARSSSNEGAVFVSFSF